MAPITDLEPGVFEAIQQVNVLGTYRCTMAAVEAMKGRGGVVINVTGRGDDLRSAKFTAAYAASKAWIRSFSRSLAAELDGTPVRVIPFNPGIMATARMSVEDHEPTASVDPVNAAAILELLLELVRQAGVTAVIASHDWRPNAIPGVQVLNHRIERAGKSTRSLFWN